MAARVGDGGRLEHSDLAAAEPRKDADNRTRLPSVPQLRAVWRHTAHLRGSRGRGGTTRLVRPARFPQSVLCHEHGAGCRVGACLCLTAACPPNARTVGRDAACQTHRVHAHVHVAGQAQEWRDFARRFSLRRGAPDCAFLLARWTYTCCDAVRTSARPQCLAQCRLRSRSYIATTAVTII